MSDGQLVKQGQLLAPAVTEQPVMLLDPRAEGGVTQYQSGVNLRMWAATISAGFKEDNTPRVVRDGKIQLHQDMGDAPGIRQALEATNYVSLTITMLSDDINECLKQMFTCYGNVKVFGDQHQLTVMRMNDGRQERKVITPADPLWRETLRMCKPSTFVPFALSAWGDDNNPFLYWPDGFIPYRLRFGSLNSARAFADSLQAIRKLTGGRLVGVPLTLTLVYKTVMTPDLKRQTVPVWNLVLKHPSGMPMRSADIQRVLTAGTQDAQMMALPASIDVDPEVVYQADELIESQLENAESGEPHLNPDAIHTVSTGAKTSTRVEDFFRATQGTPWSTDEFRPILVQEMADAAGIALESPSLRLLAEQATTEEWGTCTLVMCRKAADFHGTEPNKPPKAVATDSNPFEDVEFTAPASGPAEPPKEDVVATLPQVGSYLTLDRKPTKDEEKAATAFIKKHLSPDQYKAIGTVAGGIDPRFVILEASRKGLISYPDIRRLVDADFKVETPQEERNPFEEQGVLVQ